MPGPIDDQVVDFFQALFEGVCSEPFRSRIEQRLKRNEVIRQVEAAADAASQSLTRFFRNEQLTEEQVASVLKSLSPLTFKSLEIEDLGYVVDDTLLFSSNGPAFEHGDAYSSLAVPAIVGLVQRKGKEDTTARYCILNRILDWFLSSDPHVHEIARVCYFLVDMFGALGLPREDAPRKESAARIRRLIDEAVVHIGMDKYVNLYI